MTSFRSRATRAAVALSAAALMSAGGTAAFAMQSDDPPPAECTDTAPGTCADAYKPDDPFVAGNTKVPDMPKTISAAGLAFTKSAYKAHPGEMWTFNNADIATHNVQTDNEDPNFKNPMKFKSKDAAPGKKVKFKMPTKAGKYHILCYYHQSMTAVLTVKK
jgi:plastocyanin